MQNKVIVVAKYKENTEWCDGKNCVIIQKDVDIPNTGREASTYVWYIIQHYENLPDNMTFCQGDPFPHAKTIDCDFTEKLVAHGVVYECGKNGAPHHEGLEVERLGKELGLDLPEKIKFIPGAQFTVHKNLILKHPKSFYEKMYDLTNNFPGAPYVFERIWLYLFLDSEAIEKNFNVV